MTTKLRCDKTSWSIYSCFPLYIHLFGLTFQGSFLVFWAFFHLRCVSFFAWAHTLWGHGGSKVLGPWHLVCQPFPGSPFSSSSRGGGGGSCFHGWSETITEFDLLISRWNSMKNIVPATWQVGWVGCEKSTLVVGLWNFKYLGLLEASAKKARVDWKAGCFLHLLKGVKTKVFGKTLGWFLFFSMIRT